MWLHKIYVIPHQTYCASLEQKSLCVLVLPAQFGTTGVMCTYTYKFGEHTLLHTYVISYVPQTCYFCVAYAFFPKCFSHIFFLKLIFAYFPILIEANNIDGVHLTRNAYCCVVLAVRVDENLT